MLIKYQVVDIEGKGQGVVAAERIVRGEQIYDHEEAKYDSWTTREEFDDYVRNGALTQEHIKDIIVHSFSWKGEVINLHDACRLVNHSSNPSCDTETDCATRDIEIGEEITEDYGTYDYVQWIEDLAIELDTVTCYAFAARLKRSEAFKE